MLVKKLVTKIIRAKFLRQESKINLPPSYWKVTSVELLKYSWGHTYKLTLNNVAGKVYYGPGALQLLIKQQPKSILVYANSQECIYKPVTLEEVIKNVNKKDL